MNKIRIDFDFQVFALFSHTLAQVIAVAWQWILSEHFSKKSKLSTSRCIMIAKKLDSKFLQLNFFVTGIGRRILALVSTWRNNIFQMSQPLWLFTNYEIISFSQKTVLITHVAWFYVNQK